VGRTKDGQVYLYDPWPRKGDQMIFKDKQQTVFNAYFQDTETGQMRYSEWLSRTTPRG